MFKLYTFTLKDMMTIDKEDDVLSVNDSDDETMATIDTTIVTHGESDDAVVTSIARTEERHKGGESETPKRANKAKVVNRKARPKKSQKKGSDDTNKSKKNQNKTNKRQNETQDKTKSIPGSEGNEEGNAKRDANKTKV